MKRKVLRLLPLLAVFLLLTITLTGLHPAFLSVADWTPGSERASSSATAVSSGDHLPWLAPDHPPDAPIASISFRVGDAPDRAGISDPSLAFVIDNLWILVATALVFLMHLGFATVESGFTEAKNSVNVIYKNLFILSAGVITYALVGYGIMYPQEFNGFLGFDGFGAGLNRAALSAQSGASEEHTTPWTDFIFQAVFAATAASIVSGSVTGRIKLPSFMLFGTLLVSFSYPITGSWLWGDGWLSGLGFYDFAGSTMVHGVGGAAALACVLLLGPRKGKYRNGTIHAIPGHNIPLATIGVFLLWVGWFGFNGGSVLSADPWMVSYVFVTTALSSCSGALSAMLTTYLSFRNLDAPMALNGILAGLVGITAGADLVSPMAAVTIGAVSGMLVVYSIHLLDRLRIDDPVGAISVHGVCGIWGTIAVGLFASGTSLWIQLAGTASVVGFTFLFSFLLFGAIRATFGVRVTDKVEDAGLDLAEHGNSAYPYFMGVPVTPSLTEE